MHHLIKNKGPGKIALLLTILIFTAAAVIQSCMYARKPGETSRSNIFKAKTEEELKAEAEALKELIESKPEYLPEETYTEVEEPSGNLRIVVMSTLEEENNKDLYLVDETDTNPRRLTNFSSVESYPSITGDGKKVFFVSDMEGQERSNPFQVPTEVYVLDLDTDEIERLTYDDRTDYGVSVSADGSKIVYMTQELGKEGYENPQMVLMDGDGTNQKVIQDEALKTTLPKISGDGRWVVFNSARFQSFDIFLMDLEKNKTTNLTNTITHEYYPSINYDGSVIVYEKLLAGIQEESLYEIYRTDRKGKKEIMVTNDKFCDSFPCVTPDGQQIIFVSKRWDWDEDGHLDEALFIMNIDGSNIRKIQKHQAFYELPDV